MKTIEKTMITVTSRIEAPVEKVWVYWTDPKHIIHWNHASGDWHTPKRKIIYGWRQVRLPHGIQRWQPGLRL
jgi:uncharacterized protein YndB with AHSA1/START domain